MTLATKARRASKTTETREALEIMISQLARRTLDGYTDEQLLGQPQARTIAAVRRAVRHALAETALALTDQVSRWRLDQLLREAIGSEVRKCQGRALLRIDAAEEEHDSADQFVLVETISGVEHYALMPQEPGGDGHSA